MLWFKKRPESGSEGKERDLIVPAEITLPFDANLFQQHFSQLRQIADLDAGIDQYLESLSAKQELFSRVLGKEAIDELTLAKLEALLEYVFTARRRVFPVMAGMGEACAAEAVRELLYGEAPLADRMTAFSNAIPLPPGDDKEAIKAGNKLKRAAFDFGAEMLHFNDPVRYPLMSRWVWDQTTVSGALREFIRGNDSMAEVPLGNSPEMFEGTRKWLAEQIGEQGIYKDVPFWVDLVLAQGYSQYFRSMAEGMLSADFGRSGGPEEHVKKFLGIDGTRTQGKSRVKKEARLKGQ